MREFISRMAEGATDLAAKLAAKYHRYLDEANAKACAEAQANERAAQMVAARPDYELYAEILLEAINNTAEATHLCTVDRVSQVMHRDWFGKVFCGLPGFQYRAQYLRGYGMTSSDITAVLQYEVDQLCSIRGCYNIVVKVRLLDQGKATIEVVSAADAHRYRMEQLKKVQI